MADDDVDQLAARARTELRQALAATPPDIRRLARRARARRGALSGLIAAVGVVAVAVPLALRDQGEAARIVAGPSPAGSNADLLPPGEWRPLARAPLAGRSTMAAVWTGQQMVVWGGDGPNGQFADGATYDPRTDAWALLPESPLSARNAPAAVWTGEEVILWGGSSISGDHRDGAAYDPETRRWRSTAEAPVASAGRPVGLWTGSEMVVLAGFNSRDAAAYDPAADRWRTLPGLPGRLQAPNPVGVWATDEVVTVVQSDGPTPAGSPSVVSLRPDDDAWAAVSGLPSGQAVLASTGEALLVAAGSESFELVGRNSREVAVAPAGVAVGDTPSVWTGTELVLWQGDTASAIDPVAGTWRSIPAGGSPRRSQPAVVWADGVLLAWGGFPDHADGVMLRPPASRASSSNEEPSTAPSPDQGTAVVDFVDLRGRVASIALPASLADGFEVVEQNAGLAVDGTSWRVEATRAVGPSGVITDGCVPAPSAVIGMVGAWTVTFSGDGMTPESCEHLRQQIGSFEQRPNGVLVYRGPGSLGPIDGPDVAAATATSRLHLFHRSCSDPTETRTPSGLTVARVDDPARGATLTVLCSVVDDVEIWIEAPQWPSDEEVDAVAVR
jgi:hypothetical protein